MSYASNLADAIAHQNRVYGRSATGNGVLGAANVPANNIPGTDSPITNRTSGTSSTSQTQSQNINRTETAARNYNETERQYVDQTSSETGTVTTDRLDPTSRRALNNLLAQLQTGGNAAQKESSAALSAILQNSLTGQQEFSTAAAQAQAQKSMGLYAQQMREQVLPQLNASMEAAGMSGDALNALLAQDAATRVARQAADAEAGLITQYGQLRQGQQQVGIGASEIMQNDPVQQALMQALGIAKDSYSVETRDLLTRLTGTTDTTRTGTDTTTNTIRENSSSSSTSREEQSQMQSDLIALLNAQSQQQQVSNETAQVESDDFLKRAQATQLINSILEPMGSDFAETGWAMGNYSNRSTDYNDYRIAGHRGSMGLIRNFMSQLGR